MDMKYKRMNVDVLIGETLVTVDECGEDGILLRTASGRTIEIYHEQDCCEIVRIVGRDGEWRDLIGKVIVDAQSTESSRTAEHGEDGRTSTEIVLRVDDATVVSRWIGDSNGYYSESVDVRELFEERRPSATITEGVVGKDVPHE